jgi:hypothetical protein
MVSGENFLKEVFPTPLSRTLYQFLGNILSRLWLKANRKARFLSSEKQAHQAFGQVGILPLPKTDAPFIPKSVPKAYKDHGKCSDFGVRAETLRARALR